MPFVTNKALTATRPLEIEYDGQTLKGQILASRFTPAAVTGATREAGAAARAAARERGRLERTLLDAEAACARAQDAVDNRNTPDKPAGGHDPAAAREALERALQAVYDAEDALAVFDDRGRADNISYLSGEIAQQLESWDAEYEDGRPVPLEKSAIADALPWQFIQMVAEAISEASTPKKPTSTASPSG